MLPARLITDFGLLVLIWLVQLVIYPGFRHADPAAFPKWHAEYMHAISFFVIPLMFAQVGLTGWFVFREPSAWNLAGAGAVTLAWIATFVWSVPCHSALQAGGFQLAVIDRLVATNWIRTGAWTAATLCGWGAALRS